MWPLTCLLGSSDGAQHRLIEIIQSDTSCSGARSLPCKERRPAVTGRRYSARQLPGSAWHGFSTSEPLALDDLCKLQKKRMLVSCWRA